MRRFVLIILLCFFSSYLYAQELFPLNEPASSVPKGVIGVRLMTEDYKEISVIRNMNVARIMYGVTSNLSIYANASMSNHHAADTFPRNLAFHTHPKPGVTDYFTGTVARGLPYPMLFSGIDLYAKYRFLSVDGHKQHLRMAAYAEWSNTNVTHDEAEPTLLGDTRGYGGGLITTVLKNHLAVSLTLGFIIPSTYYGVVSDTPKGAPQIPTNLTYGNAFRYDLSFGYLLYPLHYDSYKQSSWSVYLELEGKTYEAATIVQYYVSNVPISSPFLKGGSFVEAYPGLQWIYKSNLRVDLSVGFPIINRSYVYYYYYPVVWFGVQRYFFPPHKKSKKEAQ